MLKMALTNLLPAWETKLYKCHMLDHRKVPSARHIALAYAHDPQPCTKSLAALHLQLDTPRASPIQEPSDAPQILFTPTGTPDAELSRQVDKLWQTGVLPFQKEQGITRSKRPSSPVDPLPAAH
ncbi:hypothetical protein NQZ68_012807 [Dissostichus eleginoides]|nr:hypothetical protein NQZ68_012807 [Dissostichus eleginoides]